MNVWPLARPSPTDEDAALFRAADRIHVQGQDPAAALAAWDQYLALTSGASVGRFAVEARYNRALCLIRLHREADAIAALQPFADGAYDRYRVREARALIARLGAH